MGFRADDAMKDRIFAFKVSTIVLSVFAVVAIVCIIVLIRYFIVRQRTASQYSHTPDPTLTFSAREFRINWRHL